MLYRTHKPWGDDMESGQNEKPKKSNFFKLSYSIYSLVSALLIPLGLALFSLAELHMAITDHKPLFRGYLNTSNGPLVTAVIFLISFILCVFYLKRAKSAVAYFVLIPLAGLIFLTVMTTIGFFHH